MELVGFKNNVPKSLGSHTVDLENKRLNSEKSVVSPDGKKVAFVQHDRSFRGDNKWRKIVNIFDIERKAVVEKFVCSINSRLTLLLSGLPGSAPNGFTDMPSNRYISSLPKNTTSPFITFIVLGEGEP